MDTMHCQAYAYSNPKKNQLQIHGPVEIVYDGQFTFIIKIVVDLHKKQEDIMLSYKNRKIVEVL